MVEILKNAAGEILATILIGVGVWGINRFRVLLEAYRKLYQEKERLNLVLKDAESTGAGTFSRDQIRSLEKELRETEARLQDEIQRKAELQRKLDQQEASNPTNAQAQFALGVNYYEKKDYLRAAYWYLMAAEQGNASGQSNLGVMYRNGYGVDHDDKQAVYWYRKSAEQGNASGQSNLGVMYEYGYGVPKYYAEAVKWYRKAAEQGHADGQNNLGVMYEFGQGVPKDLNEARKWYQKAAAQGHEYAKNALERLK